MSKQKKAKKLEVKQSTLSVLSDTIDAHESELKISQSNRKKFAKEEVQTTKKDSNSQKDGESPPPVEISNDSKGKGSKAARKKLRSKSTPKSKKKTVAGKNKNSVAPAELIEEKDELEEYEKEEREPHIDVKSNEKKMDVSNAFGVAVHLSKLIKTGKVKVNPDKSSTDSDEEEDFIHLLEALLCIQNYRFIFMQRILDYMDVEAAGISFGNKKVDLAYQILTLDGQLLFLIQVEKVKCTGFILYAHKCFEHIMYDVHGNKILKFTGPSIILSKMTSAMQVSDAHDRTLGYIKAFGRKVNYSVYNAAGERLFLVVSNLLLPSSTSSFTILFKGQKIGVIKHGWKESFPEMQYIDYETSGIEFPEDLDPKEKVLLLGCLILIEFFWFSPLTKLKLAVLIFGVLIVIIVIIIIVIPLIIDRPDNSKRTVKYYTEDDILVDDEEGDQVGPADLSWQ